MIQKYLSYSSLVLGFGSVLYSFYILVAYTTGYDTSFTDKQFLTAFFMGVAICFFGFYIDVKQEDPKNSEYLQRNKRYRLRVTMSGFILSVLMTIMVMSLTSCATQGYGCKGKESWNKMVKRINNGSRP